MEDWQDNPQNLLILCEKRSIAEPICEFLGQNHGVAFKKMGSYSLRGEAANILLIWTDGHLLEQVDAEEIDPKWKTWNFEDLPILPQEIPWRPIPGKQTRLSALEGLLSRFEFSLTLVATDAHREGELIARKTMEWLGIKGPARRLWLRSLNLDGIRTAWENALDLSETDGHFRAACERTYLDWTGGINFSRAMSLKLNGAFQVGRVQTSILSILKKRNEQIMRRDRTSEVSVKAALSLGKGMPASGQVYLAPPDFSLNQHGKSRDWLANLKPFRWILNKKEGEQLARIQGPVAPCAKIHEILQEYHRGAPSLLDLAGLQAEAFSRLGLSAMETLKAAQELYEKYRLISYPRSDARVLPLTMKAAKSNITL